MPVYIYDVHDYTPFHEIKDLCIQLDRATGNRSEEDRLRGALRDAVDRLQGSVSADTTSTWSYAPERSVLKPSEE